MNRLTDGLFVTDLDGTLLNSAGRLDPWTRQTLDRLLAAGLPLTIASGRTFSSIRSAVGDLAVKLPVISSDGALVSTYSSPKPLWTTGMEAEPLAALVEDCLAAGLHPMLDVWDGTDNFMGFSGLNNEAMEWFHSWKRLEDSYLPRLHSRFADWYGHTVISLTLLDRKEAWWTFVLILRPGTAPCSKPTVWSFRKSRAGAPYGCSHRPPAKRWRWPRSSTCWTGSPAR